METNKNIKGNGQGKGRIEDDLFIDPVNVAGDFILDKHAVNFFYKIIASLLCTKKLLKMLPR